MSVAGDGNPKGSPYTRKEAQGSGLKPYHEYHARHGCGPPP